MAEDKKDAQETMVDKSAEKKAADKGADKNAKAKGPGRGNRFFKFFRDTKGEFKKITGPTFGAVARNTGVTLAMCAFIGVIVCLFDFVLSSLINLMLSL